MEVFVISRENGNYYNSYEVYKIVDSEDKAKKIMSSDAWNKFNKISKDYYYKAYQLKFSQFNL